MFQLHCQTWIITTIVLLLLLLCYYVSILNSTSTTKQQPPRSTTRLSSDDWYAVIHVGPQKMASTTIQSALAHDQDIFLHDNYIARYVRALAFCYSTGKRHKLSCDPKRLQVELDYIEQAKRHHRNLFLSGEDLVMSDYDYPQLKSLFQPPFSKVIIIVNCRRFYEWLPSYYNSLFYRQRQPQIPSQVQFFATKDKIQSLYDTIYTPAVYHRYQTHFDTVRIFNMHNSSSSQTIVTDFYCTMIPNIPHTCHAAQQHSYPKSNPSRNMETKRIVFAAMSRGYLKPHRRKRRNNKDGISYQSPIMNATNDRQGLLLNQKMHSEFPRECVSPTILEFVLELSLKVEQDMLGKTWFESSRGEVELCKRFDNIGRSKFCSVDVEKVLEDEGWQEFFKAWERRRIGQQTKTL